MGCVFGGAYAKESRELGEGSGSISGGWVGALAGGCAVAGRHSSAASPSPPPQLRNISRKQLAPHEKKLPKNTPKFSQDGCKTCRYAVTYTTGPTPAHVGNGETITTQKDRDHDCHQHQVPRANQFTRQPD